MAEGALRQIFAEFGIAWDGAALAGGNVQIDAAIDKLQGLAAAFAGNALVGAIREFADGFEEAAGQLQDTADVMGTTTTELQELQHAGVMAGLSTDRASAALSHLQQASADAARGAKGPGDAFRALGVHLRDADGNVRSTADLMDDLAVNFAHVEDPARRAQLAQDLFGRSGARMLNVLHEGAGGLAEVRAELAELGGGMLPEAIEAANGYGDAMDRNRVAMQSLRSVLAVELLPRLTDLVTRGTRATAWLVRMTRDTNFAKTALYVLGVVGAAAGVNVARAWAPTILRLGGMALVIVAVAAVLEDLISLANGGPSAIGDFVDSFAGLGTAQRLAQTLNQGFEGMVQWLHEIGPEAAQLFGTDLPQWLGELGDSISAPLVAAWNVVEGAFNAVWARIGGTVTALFTRVTGTLGRLARAVGLDDLARQVTDAVSQSNVVVTARESGHDIAQVVRDVRDEYADIFNGRNGALARAAPPQVSPRGAAGGGTVVHDNRTTTLHVTGVSDPNAAAREAVRLLGQRDAARHDAAHPTNAHGSE